MLFLQLSEQIEHGIRIFAAGQADHDAIAFFDHVEVDDSLANQAPQALVEFVELVVLFFEQVRVHAVVRSVDFVIDPSGGMQCWGVNCAPEARSRPGLCW